MFVEVPQVTELHTSVCQYPTPSGLILETWPYPLRRTERALLHLRGVLRLTSVLDVRLEPCRTLDIYIDV